MSGLRRASIAIREIQNKTIWGKQGIKGKRQKFFSDICRRAAQYWGEQLLPRQKKEKEILGGKRQKKKKRKRENNSSDTFVVPQRNIEEDKKGQDDNTSESLHESNSAGRFFSFLFYLLKTAKLTILARVMRVIAQVVFFVVVFSCSLCQEFCRRSLFHFCFLTISFIVSRVLQDFFFFIW